MSNIKWLNGKKLVKDLKPFPNNPRTANEKQCKDLEKSIDNFNVADPLIINTDNVVIGGNFRLKILKAKGIKEVDVRIPDRKLTTKEANELNLRLNKNTGDFDFDVLANWDKDLLVDVGFESMDLDKIFIGEPEAKDDEVPEPPKEAKSKTGDIYILGRHRIMCGDSTKKEDVEKLMNGNKADMVFTDPPYGVSYGDKNKFLNAVGRGNRIQTNLKNDTLTSAESQKIWFDAWRNMIEVMKGGATYYICSANADLMMMMMMMSINDSGLKLKQSLVWVKNNIVLGRRDYKCQHENILYGWKEGGHKFYGRSGESSVWEFNKPQSSKLHPTMKPVELISHSIFNSSLIDHIVLDLFLGSGSTLIACEKTNRICYGMEIDPIYIDVIIKRWEDFTGQKAVKL